MTDLVYSLNSFPDNIRIEIFGLGYVGFPLAVRLATAGLNVIGIDVNSQRIERLKNNDLMDSEIHLKNEFLECREKNHLKLAMEPSDSWDNLRTNTYS